jgi:hypothetical protein
VTCCPGVDFADHGRDVVVDDETVEAGSRQSPKVRVRG